VSGFVILPDISYRLSRCRCQAQSILSGFLPVLICHTFVVLFPFCPLLPDIVNETRKLPAKNDGMSGLVSKIRVYWNAKSLTQSTGHTNHTHTYFNVCHGPFITFVDQLVIQSHWICAVLSAASGRQLNQQRIKKTTFKTYVHVFRLNLWKVCSTLGCSAQVLLTKD
jgi:hypothetical protein